MADENVDGSNSTFSKRALLFAGAGTIVLGFYALLFPFISPALRRICLPFVPATDTQVCNVMTALRQRRGGTVVDLGSGDGRLVLQAAKFGFMAEGIELNRWLVLYSRLRARSQGLHRTASFYCRDLWKMSELQEKIVRKVKDGGCLIACRFPLPSMKPDIILGSGIDTVWVYSFKQKEISYR